ncbi:ankyrin repeat domain-containing protein 34B [Onychostoma macrolepis]|uniref:ankyrin repeat domain-containing protein 34B n=1 Tax=Onychostoma macrolepis TaxID=369639 RepID=UPI00272B51F7|nr:ankyrin repeat domain-containing protein 34B [Onychostoma macrolepis]XP_058645302.1 ankyrin repeat domain-containing protein 34B [Onychostoma macrolepis]
MEGPQVVNTDGNSLLKAVYLSRLRLTRLLLEGGAYINESNECGETPLMVACRSRHMDHQSVSKAKMVGYLLESGADPNIQDKSGKTALMHACLEQAGLEVVALLLGSGADPCLEDHTGSSALIYAINASDEETLKILMDACKARGKEVIIITPDKLACGRQTAKQYLPIPPLAMVEQWSSTIVPCTSPSDILLSTSPQGTLSTSPTEHMFSFKDIQSMTNSQPTSPSHQVTLVNSRLSKIHNLQRLHSEPWLKIPQSFLAQQHAKSTSATEELPDITPEEEMTFRTNRLAFDNAPLLRHCSVDLKEANSLSQTLRQGSKGEGLRPEGALCRNMSFDSLSSLHSLSHPNLHCKSSAEALPAEKYPDKSLPNLAVSSLRNIIQRRKLGMDHYSSDSQLSVSLANSPEDRKGQLEKRKLANSRSATLVGSRESLENASLAHLHRRNPISYERRGSGVLLDPISNPRAGFLPPLNQHSPIPNITGSGNTSSISSSNKAVCGVAAGTKPCIPSAPAGFPKDLKTRRMLMRRHSMQTEQLKRHGDFTEIFGH